MVYDPRDVDSFVKGIDTTLSPEQKEYVEKLKKRLKGGKNSPKCGLSFLLWFISAFIWSILIIFVFLAWFREVPKADEMEGEGNLIPKYAENAEALIDWALSHVPHRMIPSSLYC